VRGGELDVDENDSLFCRILTPFDWPFFKFLIEFPFRELPLTSKGIFNEIFFSALHELGFYQISMWSFRPSARY
jgi:hypothetical protein